MPATLRLLCFALRLPCITLRLMCITLRLLCITLRLLCITLRLPCIALRLLCIAITLRARCPLRPLCNFAPEPTTNTPPPPLQQLDKQYEAYQEKLRAMEALMS